MPKQNSEDIRSEIRQLEDDRVKFESAKQAEWHGGLRDFDVKLRNARARLTEAVAAETRAAAEAAEKDRQQVRETRAKKDGAAVE